MSILRNLTYRAARVAALTIISINDASGNQSANDDIVNNNNISNNSENYDIENNISDDILDIVHQQTVKMKDLKTSGTYINLYTSGTVWSKNIAFIGCQP